MTYAKSSINPPYAISSILRHWLWDQFGWELIDWSDDDIRF